ncbi:MAG: DUF115 domain-containing protein [Spirochaetes bacterium]|nr:DUF115 domain-containing protein [Spirochaetota bacterium]
MNALFEKNIRALQLKDEALARLIELCADDGSITVIQAKNGPVPEIRKEGRILAIHSRVDPVKEATRFCAELTTMDFDLVVISGFGFAYHIEEILNRASQDAAVLVMEKNPLIVKKACEHRDLERIFRDPRLLLLINPSEENVAEKLRGKATRRTSFLLHRGMHQTDPEYYSNLLRIARSYLSTKEVNIATLAKFEKVWMRNVARNVGFLTDLPRATFFFGAFEGIPAIVVSAGPSLLESIPFIKVNSTKAIVIAVDTAYKILIKNGVEPHFCLTVDPQSINARYFEGDSLTDTILVADPSSHPSVFKLFKGRKVRAATAFPMMKWIDEICGDGGEIAHGGSVSTNAYDFARKLKANPIVLVGQDLAFTGGYAHAKGSHLDEQVHIRTNRFFTPEMFNRKQLTALPKIFVDGIDGRKVHTNQKMMIFLSWFERRNDPGLVNATRAGARIKGVKHCSEECIDFGDSKDLWQKINLLYEHALEEQRKIPARAHIHDKCIGISRQIDELLPVLKRAVHFAEELVTQMKASVRDGAKISYIVKKLDEIDNFIETRKKLADMIGLAIQKVVHTIMEGHDVEGEDSEMGNEEKIARRSLYLYKGLLEGAEFIGKTVAQMVAILQNTKINN